MKTVKGGTWTTEGFIPHLKHGGYDMPVKIALSRWDTVSNLSLTPPPLRDSEGRLVYATPSGGSISGGV